MKPPLLIEVLGREEAGDLLSSDACEEVSFVVSIAESWDPLPRGFDRARETLRLLFADSEDERTGPSEEHVAEIIAVAERLAVSGGRIVAHCEAGISRSSAAAVVIYAVALGEGQEREAVSRVLEQRPFAQPNLRLIEVADRLLGREGRLIEAVFERIG